MVKKNESIFEFCNWNKKVSSSSISIWKQNCFESKIFWNRKKISVFAFFSEKKKILFEVFEEWKKNFSGQKAWQLRNFLAANYDNSSLVKNFSLYYVFFDSFMLDHVEINEAKEVMTIHGKLVMTWLDLRLKWDPDQWGVSWLNFFWTQIWTPNIVQRDA